MSRSTPRVAWRETDSALRRTVTVGHSEGRLRLCVSLPVLADAFRVISLIPQHIFRVFGFTGIVERECQAHVLAARPECRSLLGIPAELPARQPAPSAAPRVRRPEGEKREKQNSDF